MAQLVEDKGLFNSWTTGFCFQNVILLSNIVLYYYKISVWDLSNTMNI